MEHLTIEQRVASAVLERATDKFEIDGVVYPIADPSIATLILVSEIVSTLPIVDKNIPKENVVYSVLHYAKDFRAIADICAILILGANHLTEEKEIPQKKFLGIIPREPKRILIDRKSELSRLILENISPSKILDIFIRRLEDMEVGYFFSITTSLSEANILKPTKEVVH